MRHNLAALNSFAEVIKVTNHIELRDVDLALAALNSFAEVVKVTNHIELRDVELALAALNSFAEVVKVTNHIELRDVELAWYSPSSTHWICLYGLEYDLEIHTFRPIWLYLFIEVLATQSKFLEPSGYCTVINSTFSFHTTITFGYFHSIIVQFELVKCEFLN